MPEVIDFDERSIWRNIFDPAAWKNLLSGVGDVAEDVASTWERLEKVKPKTLGTKPGYDPNITVSDFKFTPNVTLIIVGGSLLFLAWMIKKK